MSKKDRIWMAFGLIIGIGMMIFGPIHAFSEVTCGDQEMDKDGSCVSTRKNNTTERDYGEREAYQQRTGLIVGGIGVLLAAGSGYFLIKRP